MIINWPAESAIIESGFLHEWSEQSSGGVAVAALTGPVLRLLAIAESRLQLCIPTESSVRLKANAGASILRLRARRAV